MVILMSGCSNKIKKSGERQTHPETIHVSEDYLTVCTGLSVVELSGLQGKHCLAPGCHAFVYCSEQGGYCLDHQNYSKKFTNKYGTSTTFCHEPNCSNFIASSGDTWNCEEHSNKCLQCGKLIDSDAVYCIKCIEEALNK